MYAYWSSAENPVNPGVIDGVGVTAGVPVCVCVGVLVGVFVGVTAGVPVCVCVGVLVGVFVGVGV